MSDLFQEKIPIDFIQRVFDAMRRCAQHRFHALTRRAEYLVEVAHELEWNKNIWMGVSIENQDDGVIDGLVKIHSLSPAGKSVTFAGIPAGGWFAEGSVLKGQPFKYDIVALRDSRMALMPEATFRWLLDTSIPFNRFLLKQLNERLGQFIGMVEHDRLLEPDARVARALAALFNPHLYPDSDPHIQISQEELGYLAGASRQRVSRALQVLGKVGLIKVDHGLVTVLDLDGLQRYGG